MTALLRSIATLAIDDCWISGGVIRNAVRDNLHDDSVELASSSDVDVIYFDHSNAEPERDLIIERQLSNACTNIPWSVRNQARMHERNGDAPYRDCEDAVRCWPETATAVAARLWDRRVQIGSTIKQRLSWYYSSTHQATAPALPSLRYLKLTLPV